MTINVAMRLQGSAAKDSFAVEQRRNTGPRACARPLESLNLYSGLSTVHLNVLASNGIRSDVGSRGQCSRTAEAWRWYLLAKRDRRSHPRRASGRYTSTTNVVISTYKTACALDMSKRQDLTEFLRQCKVKAPAITYIQHASCKAESNARALR